MGLYDKDRRIASLDIKEEDVSPEAVAKARKEALKKIDEKMVKSIIEKINKSDDEEEIKRLEKRKKMLLKSHP